MSPLETNRKLVKMVYETRKDWSKKGDFGKLLVIGGSKKYSGSPALVALSAYASGCDLVTVASPERAANIVASFSPDIITVPLAGDYLSNRHLKTIQELEKNSDAIVIGNGLERSNETLTAIRAIIQKTEKPVVIDADAIYAIAHHKEILKGKSAIITPHSHEFKILYGISLDHNIHNRMEACNKVGKEFNVAVLLKGYHDAISDGKNDAINKTGNSYMTKGGTGDTLAGVCGALLSRGVNPFVAASCAAYINGTAGDLCAKDWGEGLTAEKLICYIPKALKMHL
ncbi:MAG: NAD(P)H-hydrate dehydratase [Candidatus Aenigmatarchaeota archaeon]